MSLECRHPLLPAFDVKFDTEQSELGKARFEWFKVELDHTPPCCSSEEQNYTARRHSVRKVSTSPI